MINYPVDSGLVLRTGSAWTNARDASTRGDTDATLRVVTLITRVVCVVFRLRDNDKDKGLMPET